MPESNLFNDLDAFFSPYDSQRLSTGQLHHYERKYVAGWEFSTDCVLDENPLNLRLLFRSQSGYILPDVAVFPDALHVLDYPHIEEESRLCVWDSIACCDNTNYEYLLALLEDALELLKKLLSGGCVEDFRQGFLSYWRHNIANGFSGITLCDPLNSKSRAIFLAKSIKHGLVFGDQADIVRSWLINAYNYPENETEQSKTQQRFLRKVSPSALFCFDQPWIPEEYPTTVEELKRLVVPAQFNDEDFANLIGSALNNRLHSQTGLLLRFQNGDSPCFAGLSFSKGIFSPTSVHSKGNLLDGFRENIPYKELLNRAKSIKTMGVSVARGDPSWIHGRDNATGFSELKHSSIIIIGCGSVGSSIARLLIKSGISKFILIDGDALEQENASRHELGASSVGKNKAKALKEVLQRDFPSGDIVSVEKRWQQLHSEKLKKYFNEADIIVSATADWFSDLGLIDIQRELTLGPIVFTFTEAHAVASHVIVHTDDSGAYQATHHMQGESVGTMKIPCSLWEQPTRIVLPTCGGSFQPYGAASLSYLHSMAAEIIIDLIIGTIELNPIRKVWLGSPLALNNAQGKWNPNWLESYGDPGHGNMTVTLELKEGEWVHSDD